MNIFNYESKVNQVLMLLADVIILNLLYVVCCLPIFTIGAAQAGLFTGIRVLLDKEDDSSCAKAFFRGFGSGFKTITIANLIMLVVLALATYLVYILVALRLLENSSLIPLVLSIVALVLVYATHCIMGPFHATFGCTVGQLIRNAFFVVVAYPLRSLVLAVLMALPLALLLTRYDILMGGMIALLALYYSTVYLMGFSLLKKPFQRLKDSFYAAQKRQQEAAETPEEIPSEQSEDLTDDTTEEA